MGYLREWNDHEEDCSDRCGPRARSGRQPRAEDNAVGNEANVEDAANADVNAATNDAVDASNAAENALDTAGNAIENAGDAVENAGEAVANAADNAAD